MKSVSMLVTEDISNCVYLFTITGSLNAECIPYLQEGNKAALEGI